MVNFLEKIRELDNFLLDSKYGFENVTKFIQKTFGPDCFTQGIFSIFVFCIIMFLSSNNLYEKFIYIAISASATVVFKMMKNIVKVGSFANPMRDSRAAVLLRIISLILVITPPQSLKSMVQSIAIMYTWYAISCTPLPPGDSWLRKKWENVKSRFSPSLQGA